MPTVPPILATLLSPFAPLVSCRVWPQAQALGQGYVFARPMPPEQIAALLCTEVCMIPSSPITTHLTASVG